MFFILSKVLYILVMPLTIISAFIIVSFGTKNKKTKKIATISSIGLFFLFTNNFIANELISLWEIPATPFEEIQSTYATGIILTGVSDSERKPFDRVYYRRAVDRVLHTHLLYKKGIIEKICITGGRAKLIEVEEPIEAESIKETLLLFGVPREDIIIEGLAKNTHENAVFSANILNKLYPGRPHLVVTSAFHMRRAKACFDKAGLNTAMFSTDFYGFERKFTPNILLVPSSDALTKWEILIKEIIGTLTYKIIGYIE
jgi:uncharacterized SAM-binding protein YcdF (DUF218 family)